MENTVELEWRSAEGEPALIQEPVLCQTNNKKLIVFQDTCTDPIGSNEPVSNWKWLREKYNIKCWTYVQEIVI